MLSQIIRFYGHAMQGMMGSYLEKNLQTFTDIQARLPSRPRAFTSRRYRPRRCGRSS
jgi:polyhydroxyalkanoate synthesis regulator protein